MALNRPAARIRLKEPVSLAQVERGENVDVLVLFDNKDQVYRSDLDRSYARRGGSLVVWHQPSGGEEDAELPGAPGGSVRRFTNPQGIV
jgi:hypothetical protein